MAVKVSLTERVSIETPEGVVVDAHRFPGRQGRLVFAYLLAADGRAVPRDELADALWGQEPPARWEKALSVIVSKLRALLSEAGLDGAQALTSAFGCYQLKLPADSWIDVTAADEAATAAEHALLAGDTAAAIDDATTAASLARRTFLPGEDGRWVSERRAELQEILVRALECLADAALRAGDQAASIRSADELVALEPFRESGYRLLMQAQSAAGNDAEALRTYERCRSLLAEELGAYPSSETEAVYLELLRGSSKTSAVDGVPALAESEDDQAPRRYPRKLVVALAGAVLVAGMAIVVGAVASRDPAPLVVPPTSVVRIDPRTLEPTQAVRIGPRADLVVAAGGYVWSTHGLFRYDGDDLLRDAGDRVLTRVDPSTGEATVVGGGLAPCGLTADPSGDVWVANCFASERGANVVRVDAETLDFEKTIPVPGGGPGYFRGVTFGGGSLWIANVSGGGASWGITEVDPQTGSQRSIGIDRHAGWLAWAEGYGDLWFNSFGFGSGWGSVSRLHPQTRSTKSYDSILGNPASIVVDGDVVWIGTWSRPDVIRVSALGRGAPRVISLPAKPDWVGVTTVATGAGYIWATLPNDRAVWRIDPETNEPTRIELPAHPWGVAASDDGIWVSLRANALP